MTPASSRAKQSSVPFRRPRIAAGEEAAGPKTPITLIRLYGLPRGTACQGGSDCFPITAILGSYFEVVRQPCRSDRRDWHLESELAKDIRLAAPAR